MSAEGPDEPGLQTTHFSWVIFRMVTEDCEGMHPTSCPSWVLGALCLSCLCLSIHPSVFSEGRTWQAVSSTFLFPHLPACADEMATPQPRRGEARLLAPARVAGNTARGYHQEK